MMNIFIIFSSILYFIPGTFCISLNFNQFRLSDAETSSFACFEKDTVPVDNEEIFEDQCVDDQGNKYSIGSSLSSCCHCIIYTCNNFGTFQNNNLLFWNTTVSDTCCLSCDGTVYKADEVIDVIENDDECQSIETSICRILPGFEHATIEKEYNYKSCCNDNTGLHSLNSSIIEPKTCSERSCFYSPSLSHSTWISTPVFQDSCDCCVHNGSMVPDGWSQPLSFFSNITCCKGEIVETLPPALDICDIQNMTYLIDTSGSMGSSRVYWEPAGLEMVEFMVMSHVNPAGYTLMDYETSVSVVSTHTDSGAFRNAIQGIDRFSGGTELTYKGLLEALNLSPCHNFIMVFTDELGNDTGDQDLKSQILTLRDQKKSIIFFMIVGNLTKFESVFGEVGHVFKIDVSPSDFNNVLQDVTKIMVDSDICKEACAYVPGGGGGSTTSPSTPMIITTPSPPPPPST